jgi:Ca2+-binding RTX toxin-like protein
VVAWQLLSVPVAQARASCHGRAATILGTRRPDRIKGTAGDDVIVAGGGPDLVRASGGNDLVCAGRGTDLVIGGGGNDQIKGQGGADELFGGTGNDTLEVNAGLYQYVAGGAGDDRLIGNTGFVVASYVKAPGGVAVDLGSGISSGAHGHDVLIDVAGVEGSPYDDTLAGDAELNFLFGGGGDDSLSGEGNTGTMGDLAASEGNPEQTVQYDYLAGGQGDDSLLGADGVDVAAFDQAQQPIEVDLTAGSAEGEGSDVLSRIDVVLGSPFVDTLTGDHQANGFEGYGGADMIDGRAGQDVAIHYVAQGVTADLAAGTATASYTAFTEVGPISDTSTDSLKDIEDVWGSSFDDNLVGDHLANQLYGLAGRDHLEGAAGDDLLLGGLDSDTADGGDGNDICDAEVETACDQGPGGDDEPEPLGWGAGEPDPVGDGFGATNGGRFASSRISAMWLWVPRFCHGIGSTPPAPSSWNTMFSGGIVQAAMSAPCSLPSSS